MHSHQMTNRPLESNATRILTMADGKRIKAEIWDTAGQERYRAITTAYYRGALGALLVCELPKISTLENIPRWLREMRDHASRDIVLVIVAAKKDLVEVDSVAGAQPQVQRQITREAAQSMSEELAVPYIETSAKSGEGVEQAFMSVIERIYSNVKAQQQKSQTGSAPVQAQPAQPQVQLNAQNVAQQSQAAGGCCG